MTDIVSTENRPRLRPGDRVVIAPKLENAFGKLGVEDDLLFNRKPSLTGTIQDHVVGHEESATHPAMWVLQEEHDIFDPKKKVPKLAPYFCRELSFAH